MHIQKKSCYFKKLKWVYEREGEEKEIRSMDDFSKEKEFCKEISGSGCRGGGNRFKFPESLSLYNYYDYP